nr:hypothetical protein CFP56_04184 [Quercus suber]
MLRQQREKNGTPAHWRMDRVSGSSGLKPPRTDACNSFGRATASNAACICKTESRGTIDQHQSAVSETVEREGKISNRSPIMCFDCSPNRAQIERAIKWALEI